MTGRAVRVVHSVGHGSRSIDELADLLRWAGVTCIADVRRFPRSRRHPQFDRPVLERSLETVGVAYHHFGEVLGGFRNEGYAEHARRPEFAAGVGELARLAEERPTAFLCAERRPDGCHRAFIARALEARGWDVRHLVEPGQLWHLEPASEQLGLF